MKYKIGDMVRNTATNKAGVVLEIWAETPWHRPAPWVYRVEYATSIDLTIGSDLEMMPPDEPWDDEDEWGNAYGSPMYGIKPEPNILDRLMNDIAPNRHKEDT